MQQQRANYTSGTTKKGGGRFRLLLLSFFLVGALLFSGTSYTVQAAAGGASDVGWWPRISAQLSHVWSVAFTTSRKIFSGEAFQLAQLGRSSNELWSPEVAATVASLNTSSQYVPSASREQGTLVINVPLLIDTNLRISGDTSLASTSVNGILRAGVIAANSVSVSGTATFGTFRTSAGAQIGGALVVRGGITTAGASVNLEGGELFASNVVNEVVAGDNVTVTGTRSKPIVSLNLDSLDVVTSINGESGSVEFEEGDDISISGTTIDVESTLSSVRGRGGCAACILDADVVDALSVRGGTVDDTIIGATTATVAYFTTVTIGATSTSASLTVHGDVTVNEVFTVAGTATSTFGGGINITDGCYAVDGVCIAGAAPASYVGLTDTPNVLLAGALQFANASATALTQSSNLVFINDRLGIGTSTPEDTLSVVGGSSFTGSFLVTNSTSSEFVGGINVRSGCVSVDGACLGGATDLDGLDDVTISSATTSDFLQYDGAVWRNVPLATLGFGDGSYLGLDDTPDSFIIGALQFANAAGTALTQSATLVFSGGNLRVGTTSVATRVSVDGDISLVDTGVLRFYGSGTSNYVGFMASSTVVTDTVWTLPIEDGSTNQILTTDGSGNLIFQDVSAIGGGVSNYLDLSDTPNSFVAGAIQYAHASGTYLTQSSSFVFTGTNLGIGVAVPVDKLSVDGSVKFAGSGGTAGLYFSQNNTRLGIGTDSPTDRLTVLGGSILQQGGNSSSEYSPSFVGGVALTDSVFDLDVAGSYAYLVSSAAGNDFHVIDISNPTAPAQVTSINMSGTAQAIAVRGQYAFVGTDTAGNNFHVIDISDPSSPAIMTGIVLPGSVNDIVVMGRYAYVVTDSSGFDLSVVDISDPLNPIELGGIDLPTNTESVAVQGEYAYVAVAGVGDEFYIINISDPLNPVSVASLPLSDAAFGIAVDGGYAYVTTNSIGDDLHVIDISSPAAPVEVDSVALDAAGRGVVVTGNYVYVATLSTGDDIEVVDVSTPSTAFKVGGANLGAGDAYGIEIVGRYAYMTTSSGGNDFHVLDISGASLQSAVVYSIAGSYLTISNDVNVAGLLRANGGIFAGLGGLVTDGSFISYGADASYIDGSLGIGTTSTSSKLTVAGSITSTSLLGGAVGLTTDANGVIIRDPSDERLKEHVTDIEGALSLLTQLRGVRYAWRDKNRFGEQIEIGFIAQEVDLVLPEVVRKGGDYWSLNTRNIIAVVVEGVKEIWNVVQGHSEQIETLEARVSELEAVLEIQTSTGETPLSESADVSPLSVDDVEASVDPLIDATESSTTPVVLVEPTEVIAEEVVHESDATAPEAALANSIEVDSVTVEEIVPN